MKTPTTKPSLKNAIHALSFKEREALMNLICRGVPVEGALAQVTGQIVTSWGGAS